MRRPKGERPDVSIRLWNQTEAQMRLIDELRKGPPRGGRDDLPPIDLSDFDEAEVAQIRAVTEMIAAKQRRKQIELDKGEYEY